MNKFQRSKKVLIFSLVVWVILLSLVASEFTCDEEDENRDKGKALRYKIAALVSILICNWCGYPLLGKIIPALSPEKHAFFFVKAFVAGVILATGFIHVLPDAFENLNCPCLKEHPWGDFHFTGFVAMCTAMGTLMVDTYATTYFQKQHFKGTPIVKEVTDVEMEHGHEGNVHLHTQATHGHAHGHFSSHDDSSELLRHRVISQCWSLELANFKKLSVTIMGLFFALTNPVGIGIGITNIYDESSPTALIVEGIFNAASSGILNPRMQKSGSLRLGANISLLFGAGCMSLIAKWA
uniref:Zinc transporter 1 n=1 Tax=Cajanus cajan TaxID=3821 RepID=A0A151RJR7_CAJCA|nr:Zinc transporter 1 [Cajanus cajan]